MSEQVKGRCERRLLGTRRAQALAKETRNAGAIPSELAIPLPLFLEAGFSRWLPRMGALSAARLVRANDSAEGARNKKATSACFVVGRLCRVPTSKNWRFTETPYNFIAHNSSSVSTDQPTRRRLKSCLSSPCDAAFCAARDILRRSASL